ncbi:hypothetical protein niasHT_010366 [Heterodera trifolii]|uniref:C2H2-type domain-containing protein n=1 Tax=Heterodera trifolii TaxID=157864 RepID=A0ABD2M6P6_9BILA
MFNCQICISECVANASNSPRFSSFDQLEAHLAADHFSLLPYECEHCQFAKFPTEFAVMKHNEMDHDSRNYSFRCRITPEVKEKRSKIREFLTKVTEREKHLNERAEKEQFASSPMEVEKKRKTKDGQTKNSQIKGNDGKEEEKPKRMCLRPRPFSSADGNTTAKNCESANGETVVSFGGEEEEDDEDEDMEGEGSSLTDELKEQQAIGDGQVYSLRPNRFKTGTLCFTMVFPFSLIVRMTSSKLLKTRPKWNHRRQKVNGNEDKSKTFGSRFVGAKSAKKMRERERRVSQPPHQRTAFAFCRCSIANFAKEIFSKLSNTRITKHMHKQAQKAHAANIWSTIITKYLGGITLNLKK